MWTGSRRRWRRPRVGGRAAGEVGRGDVVEIEVGVVAARRTASRPDQRAALTTPRTPSRRCAPSAREKGRDLTALTFGNVHGGASRATRGCAWIPAAGPGGRRRQLGPARARSRSRWCSMVVGRPPRRSAARRRCVVKMNIDTETQAVFTRPVGRACSGTTWRAEPRRGGLQQEGLRPGRTGARRPRPAWPSAWSRPPASCAPAVRRSAPDAAGARNDLTTITARRLPGAGNP